MTIALIDVDSHNHPNLALMKLSAWHKAQGDEAEMWNPLRHYDIAYKAKVFDATYSQDEETLIDADRVVCGGTGYSLATGLPSAVEHTMPDYSLYGIAETAYGFTTRGCPRGCGFCIVGEKEGLKSVRVADIGEFWSGQKRIQLLDPNILACADHMGILAELAKTKAWIEFEQGLDCRMLTEDNIHALNGIKQKAIHFAWDKIAQSDKVIDGLTLYRKLGKIKDIRRIRAYVLINYDTTPEEDLYRIYRLQELGIDPYVMVFNKPNAPTTARRMQRWCNNKIIYRACQQFENYGKGA